VRIAGAVVAALASVGFTALWFFETIVRGGTCDGGQACPAGIVSYAAAIGAVACFVIVVVLMLGVDSKPRP